MILPDFAISIRQPWAWAIVAGHKPIENRSASVAGRFRKLRGQRIAIHAAWNMADSEYEAAAAFMRARCGIDPPPPDRMWFGGIIGSALVGEVVAASSSPWFAGPFGVMLSDPQELEFVDCRGWPGVFKFEKAGARTQGDLADRKSVV